MCCTHPPKITETYGGVCDVENLNKFFAKIIPHLGMGSNTPIINTNFTSKSRGHKASFSTWFIYDKKNNNYSIPSE